MVVLIISADPTRRAALARPYAGTDTHVIAARNPLEGLWSAPDVDAILLDDGSRADLVQLEQRARL